MSGVSHEPISNFDSNTRTSSKYIFLVLTDLMGLVINLIVVKFIDIIMHE